MGLTLNETGPARYLGPSSRIYQIAPRQNDGSLGRLSRCSHRQGQHVRDRPNHHQRISNADVGPLQRPGKGTPRSSTDMQA